MIRTQPIKKVTNFNALIYNGQQNNKNMRENIIYHYKIIFLTDFFTKINFF